MILPERLRQMSLKSTESNKKYVYFVKKIE